MPEPTIREIFKRKIEKGDVGIEIEVEGEHIPIQNPEGWYIKGEGSLRGQAAEFITRGAISSNSVPNYLKKLQDFLSKHNSILYDTGRAGVHIHLNCQQLTVREVFNLILLYIILEESLIQYCGKDRVGNLFCLGTSDAEEILYALRKAIAHNELVSLQDPNEYRYSSLNVSSLSKFGSLEFRAMRFVPNFIDLLPWINMLLRIRNASFRFQRPHHIVENFSIAGPKGFAKEILGGYYSIVEQACDGEINKMLLNGIRRAQIVAYAPQNQPEMDHGWIANIFDEVEDEDEDE